MRQPFSFLVNFLFERGKVPSSWKLGEIVPVHKKDCTLTKTNYRPITILQVLSKVFEKLVHSRLSLHRISITAQSRGITVVKEVAPNLKKSMNELRTRRC